MKITGFLRVIIKFPLFALALTGYFMTSMIIVTMCGFNFTRARPYLTKVIALTGKVGLKIIGIKVMPKFTKRNPVENFLIVSNHLSYLDVLIISSYFPSCFITSKEMKETFFLGQLCLLGGCLFVDRKNRSNIHNEVKELTSALYRGLNVAIFPEAATTNGTSVLAFRRPLFQAALDAGAKVLPICLNYKSIDAQELSLQNRDLLFWYDEMPFLGHVLKLFAQKKIVVELTVFPSFYAQECSDKIELSQKCYELISAEYKKIVS